MHQRPASAALAVAEDRSGQEVLAAAERAAEFRRFARSRITVTWLEGRAHAFFTKPADAHERVATLRLAGFEPSIVWPEGM